MDYGFRINPIIKRYTKYEIYRHKEKYVQMSNNCEMFHGNTVPISKILENSGV